MLRMNTPVPGAFGFGERHVEGTIVGKETQTGEKTCCLRKGIQYLSVNR